MTIRTKIWLIAVSVAVTVGVASWGRMYLTRSQIIKDAQTAAEELAHDIAEDLKSVQADADDRDLEEKLLGYLNRHSRIVRLDLYVYREAYTPSSRIAAPRGDRPEITRFAPFVRQPLGFTKQQTVGAAQEQPIELPVDLQGPWKATLVMKWTLGPVETMLKTEEQISLIFAAVFVVVLDAGLRLDHAADHRAAAGGAGGGDARRRGRRPRRAACSVETVDEIGRLSHGFNRMLERLSQADAQIRAFNQRLAAEIEAATHDLSEKNATLAQLNRLLNDMRLDNASKVRLATLGQLAAQLAHEIGTPLSSVSGHVQLALRERELPAALRERLEVSAREIERISKIVRDYLDSTRPLEPERQPTALPRLLEEAVEIVRGVAPGKRGRRRDHLEGRARRRRGRHRPGPAAPDRRQPAIERARRRRPQRQHRAGGAPRGRRRADHRQRHRARHRARRPAPHLRAVLHDQGARQGHRPGPGDLPPADGGAGRHDLRRERAGQGLDVLRPHPAARAADRGRNVVAGD